MQQEASTINIQLKIEGPAFKKGVPLLEITTALQEFHYILGKSYLARTGFSKMSPKERETFTIIATEIRQGSFIADLQLFLFLSKSEKGTVLFIPNKYQAKKKE